MCDAPEPYSLYGTVMRYMAPLIYTMTYLRQVILWTIL